VTGWRVLLSRLLGRGRDAAALDEEFAAHLELLARDYERRGLSAEDARAAARREFGPVTQLRESYREQRRAPWVDTLWQDLVYALRQLRRNPGFAAAAVFTLALGIGANTAIYQVLDAVVYRPLPVPRPDQLVQVQLLDNNDPVHVSYPLYRELAARQHALDGLFAVSEFPLREAVLRGRGPLRAVRGSLVTGNYFQALGINARFGRTFTADDDRPNATPVAVISDEFWEREFGRSPAALGQALELNHASATIIGVAPPEFFGETVGNAPDVWLPIIVQPRVMASDWLNAPSSSWLAMLARLHPGVSPRQAEQALEAVYRPLAGLSPKADGHRYQVRIQPASRGIAELQERFGTPLRVMMGIVGLVLVIACVNLANLLLGRAASRTLEFGVRLAVGAGRARLIRQLLTECLAITALGTLAALPLATWGAQALVAWASVDEKWRLSLQPNWRVLAFTAAIALLATCLFGLAPTLAATRLDVHAALRRGQTAGRPHNALGRLLVVAQLTVSLVLLSGAALLSRSLWNLRHQDFGFQREGTLVVDLPVEFNRAMMKRNTALRQPLYERLNALPGVRSASVVAFGPMGSMQHTSNLAIPTRPAQQGDFTRVVHVAPRYLEAMRIPLAAGRPIDDRDRDGAPRVAVLSETAARALFGADSPVGRTISESRQYDARQAIEIVGVARDVRFGNPREPHGFVLYVPLEQEPAPITAAVLRPSNAALAPAIRAAVREIDASVLVGAIRPLDEIVDAKLGNDRVLSTLGICFAGLSLVLVGVGVYGVLSYAVERRTQEIGIRLTLGAARGTVARLMMRDIAGLLLAGTLCGGVCAWIAARALRSLIFAFAPADYGLLAGAAALLLAIAALAGYLPARRAARLDPIEALRQE
jgi:predicted permease